MAAGDYFVSPAAAGGVAVQSGSPAAWSDGAAVTLIAAGAITVPAALVALWIEPENSAGPDTTYETIFRILVDGVEKAVIPYSWRTDTAQGFYFPTSPPPTWIEPFEINAGAEVTCVAAASTLRNYRLKLLLRELPAGTPKAGADANGSVTESGSKTESSGDEEKAGADASGGTADVTALTTALPGDDVSAGTVESAAHTAAISDGDVSGGTAETASPAASLPGQDSSGGTVEVAAAPAAAIPAVDTGTAAEASAVTVPVADADASGGTAEATSLQAALSGADVSDAASESGALTAASWFGQDAQGPTVEQASLDAEETKLGADTNGPQVESAVVTVVLVADDSGTAVESGTLTASVAGGDVGVGGDVATGGGNEVRLGEDASSGTGELATVKVKLSTTGGGGFGRVSVPVRPPTLPAIFYPDDSRPPVARRMIHVYEVVQPWRIKEFAWVDPPPAERQRRAEEEALLWLLA